MSGRGRGSCPSCHEEYFNRSKPPKCPKCGCFLGGTFYGPRKKVKSASPALVEINTGVFSCRTAGYDRCFVTSRGGLWLCTREECKISRSVHVNSAMASQYECEHVKQAKAPANCDPVAVYQPTLSNYPCSESVKDKLREVVASLPGDTPPVVQVSEQSFAVFGLPTASNPLGFCHVKKEGKSKVGYVCTAKDCRQFASKAKGSTVKAVCLHLHLLFASLEQFQQAGPSNASPSAASETSEPSTVEPSPNLEDSSQRISTILLAHETRRLPYHIPRDLLRSIMKRDSNTLFGVEGSWPILFLPRENQCGLCGSSLGLPTNHPGQQTNNTYLITELNPFKKVDVKVKTCISKECLAMHQPFPQDVGK